MDAIIKVENLVKSYGDVLAVRGISFEVKRGSLFAFLGPNGAGKTTTINIMTTLLNADSGKIYLNDQTNETYFRNKIGVVFQGNVLDDDLTVKENLIYRGSLYINNKEKVEQRYQELSQYLNLVEFENQRYKTLSGGQKRRTEIARALFSDPEILLLDEPTTGLDPETRQTVWRVIEDLRTKKGLTIFLTTHYMEEAANSDHVVIISKGKIVAQGTPTTLKDKYSYDRLKVVPYDKKRLAADLDGLKRSYVKVSSEYIITIDDAKDAIDLINVIKDNIKQFEVIKGSMDDVFINVIGGENNV
ncbi:ABC transporter ATP-binding protein [Peloplasma aerotolerans]|uniref:ABC transporter ATP-binding protein n=1 Tax=Peloplasma aerotolerans TaxID=3044389 RepID=A0AAW6UBU9_9MOLU|nr:ABC transporter ATP-binding protein [Mariniplasma sp. M4Ah]MDI6452971.1 ABC transporter ATP-binding protein [Mariniplasma sp. M4Ah]